MYLLKRQTADVSSEAVPMKNRFLTRERPARIPPSTFLFLRIHMSNSPGTMTAPPSGEPKSRRSSCIRSTVGCQFTVPVRSFRGAQSRRKRTARRWSLYMLWPRELSTENAHFPCATGAEATAREDAQQINNALIHIRRTEAIFLRRPWGPFEGRNRNGGLQPPSIRPVSTG